MLGVYSRRLLAPCLIRPLLTSRRFHTTMSSPTPIQTLQAAWKRIAPLELADNSWDNVSGFDEDGSGQMSCG